MDGFLLVNKEKNLTSFQVCNKLKYKLKLDKTGHTGTLDPLATGLMIVGVNKATKLMKFFDYDDKIYETKIIFGIKTDSFDMDGNILDKKDMDFSLDELLTAISKVKKQEYQIPPQKSAIKLNGKRLYSYKDELDLKDLKRNVKINDVKVLNFYKNIEGNLEADIYLDVSKGFYVRSFANDLGEALSGYATVKELKRVGISKYNLKDAKLISEITESDIIKIEDFLNLPFVDINKGFLKFVYNGIVLDERQTKMDGAFYVRCEDKIVAIYEKVDENRYKPVVIFK